MFINDLNLNYLFPTNITGNWYKSITKTYCLCSYSRLTLSLSVGYKETLEYMYVLCLTNLLLNVLSRKWQCSMLYFLCLIFSCGHDWRYSQNYTSIGQCTGCYDAGYWFFSTWQHNRWAFLHQGFDWCCWWFKAGLLNFQ